MDSETAAATPPTVPRPGSGARKKMRLSLSLQQKAPAARQVLLPTEPTSAPPAARQVLLPTEPTSAPSRPDTLPRAAAGPTPPVPLPPQPAASDPADDHAEAIRKHILQLDAGKLDARLAASHPNVAALQQDSIGLHEILKHQERVSLQQVRAALAFVVANQ